MKPRAPSTSVIIASVVSLAVAAPVLFYVSGRSDLPTWARALSAGAGAVTFASSGWALYSEVGTRALWLSLGALPLVPVAALLPMVLA